MRATRSLLTIAALAALCTGQLAAQQKTQPATRPRTLAEDLQLFSQVLNQIRVNHADSVDSHALLLAAMEGMVAASDPHSYVIPAVRLNAERHAAWIAGKLHPVALDFRFVDGAPIVSAIAPGSRVSRLDVMVGDELIEIDGHPLDVGSPAELAYTLAGPKGTQVKTRFERRRSDGSIVQLERTLPRERPDDSRAAHGMMLDSVTGYVRLLTFETGKAADDLNARIEELERAGMQRLILDLRDNGGGRIDQAADVAGSFLPSGAIVYSIAGAKKELTDTGRVKRVFFRSERRYPLIVMVNSGTASASELVAAALQDHDRALLVGRPTFGKALVMLTLPLTDGSLMALSVGRVSTPCGRLIQREYRGLSRRHYLRTAGAEADTAGRPSCKTKRGRTVYGGNGVMPDVMLPTNEIPSWLARLRESDALITWSAGHARSAPLLTLQSFGPASLSADAIEDFRKFASTRGVNVPQDSAGTELLTRSLARTVAYAKWGDEGLFRVATLTDPEVRAASEIFPRASQLLSGVKE